MAMLLFPFHSWGTGTWTQLTICPKLLRQSTKEKKKINQHTSESQVRALIGGPFLLTDEMSQRSRLIMLG